MDEKALVFLAKRGDEEAFYKLYKKYDRRIESFIYARVNNINEAEDILGEIWEKVVLHLGSCQGKYENSFSLWLFTIARNSLYNFYKRSKRYEMVNLEDLPEIFFSECLNIEDTFQRENIHAFVEQLPFKQRKIIQLKYFKNLQNKEIALYLKISEKTVSSALSKALKKLTRIRE